MVARLGHLGAAAGFPIKDGLDPAAGADEASLGVCFRIDQTLMSSDRFRRFYGLDDLQHTDPPDRAI